MIGLEAHPATTLAERVVLLLGAKGPKTADALCTGVLGMAGAPMAVAERLAVALLAADPRVRQLADGRWSLVAEACGSPLIEECAFAVVDVETTGSRPTHGDRITEIAVVLAGPGGRIETILETLVNPERPIPGAVTRVTQISNDMVLDKPLFGEVVDDLLSALGGRVFVAHNVQFDWRFLEAEVRRARDLRLDGPRLCTVKLARRLIPGLKHRGLDSVSRYFGVEIEGRHRAGGDARATARILVRLLELGAEQGARTLDDLTRVDARVRGRKTAGPGWMEAI